MSIKLEKPQHIHADSLGYESSLYLVASPVY